MAFSIHACLTNARYDIIKNATTELQTEPNIITTVDDMSLVCDGSNDCGDWSDEFSVAQNVHNVQIIIILLSDNNVTETFLCGNETQIITSPGYPNHYGNNQYIEWTFTTHTGSFLSVDFYDFHLENNYDNVTIYSDGEMVARFSDSKNTPQKTIYTNSTITVVFNTDSSVVYKGFQAKVSVYPEAQDGLCFDFNDGYSGWTQYYSNNLWMRSSERYNVYDLGNRYSGSDDYYIYIANNYGYKYGYLKSPYLPDKWNEACLVFYYYMSGSSYQYLYVNQYSYFGSSNFFIENDSDDNDSRRWKFANVTIDMNNNNSSYLVIGGRAGYYDTEIVAVDNIYISEGGCSDYLDRSSELPTEASIQSTVGKTSSITEATESTSKDITYSLKSERTTYPSNVFSTTVSDASPMSTSSITKMTHTDVTPPLSDKNTDSTSFLPSAIDSTTHKSNTGHLVNIFTDTSEKATSNSFVDSSKYFEITTEPKIPSSDVGNGDITVLQTTIPETNNKSEATTTMSNDRYSPNSYDGTTEQTLFPETERTPLGTRAKPDDIVSWSSSYDGNVETIEQTLIPETERTTLETRAKPDDIVSWSSSYDGNVETTEQTTFPEKERTKQAATATLGNMASITSFDDRNDETTEQTSIPERERTSQNTTSNNLGSSSFNVESEVTQQTTIPETDRTKQAVTATLANMAFNFDNINDAPSKTFTGQTSVIPETFTSTQHIDIVSEDSNIVDLIVTTETATKTENDSKTHFSSDNYEEAVLLILKGRQWITVKEVFRFSASKAMNTYCYSRPALCCAWTECNEKDTLNGNITTSKNIRLIEEIENIGNTQINIILSVKYNDYFKTCYRPTQHSERHKRNSKKSKDHSQLRHMIRRNTNEYIPSKVVKSSFEEQKENIETAIQMEIIEVSLYSKRDDSSDDNKSYTIFIIIGVSCLAVLFVLCVFQLYKRHHQTGKSKHHKKNVVSITSVSAGVSRVKSHDELSSGSLNRLFIAPSLKETRPETPASMNAWE
ncbi:uncharacterized protein [Antedon mediterranea]|uniref:uncharacterized protein n=1 Tax=Antedon mediterranea TaxID=105859 RepID=UPI003AF7F66F